MFRATTLLLVAALACAVTANPRVRFGNDVYIAHSQIDPTSSYQPCSLAFQSTYTGLNNETAVPAPDDDDARAVLAALTWGGQKGVLGAGTAKYATGPFRFTGSNIGSGDEMTLAPDGRAAVTSCASFVLLKLTDEPVQAGETIVRASAEDIVNFVTFDGADYATIDDSPAADTATGGLRGTRRYVVPYGWIMAPPTADSQIARIGHPFGAHCMLTSDGTGYTRNGQVCALGGVGGDGALVNTTVFTHTLTRPAVRSGYNILITRPSNLADSWTARPSAFANSFSGGSLNYATLDDGIRTDGYSNSACDLRARRLPPGWTLASDAATNFPAAANSEWGAVCLLGDPSNTYGSWVTRTNDYSLNCTRAVELVTVQRGGETYYAPSACSARILISKQSSFTIGFKTLIIATVPSHERDPRLGVAETYLQGIGAPYDIFYVVDETTDQRFYETEFPESVFYEADGTPKYYVILKTHAAMFYDPPGSLIPPYDALTEEQDLQINSYAAAFSVRVVNLYSQALYVTGLEPAGSPGLDDMAVIFDSSVTQAEAPGLNLDTQFDTTSIFHFPARYDGSGAANIRPIFRFRKYSPQLIREFGGEFDNTFAGVIVNEAGTEQIHLFYDSSKFFTFSNLFANYWFNWASRGMYIGERRIYLSTQVDDFFLYTLAFNDTSRTNGVSESDEVRMVESDVDELIAWQDNLNNNVLPAGSNFTVEMAYNMDGINVFKGYNPELGGVDTLLEHLLANNAERRNKFFWESHTFSHKSMTCIDSGCAETEFACVSTSPRDPRCASYVDVSLELSQNYVDAVALLFENNATALDLYHSDSAMVTPLISGLFNAEALQAMLVPDPGVVPNDRHKPILFAVGDGSRPELNVELPNNADSPYHAINTSVAVHGYDGVIIVPRWATRIYYNAVDPIDEQVEHDCIYGACYEANTAGNNPNGLPGIFADRMRQFWEMLEFEANFFLPRLIGFRHDPYMFHQANLIFYEYNGTAFDPPDESGRWAENERTCLLCQWVDRIVEGIMDHYTLPILTLRHDALGYRFLSRQARDECGLGGSFSVVDGLVTAVNLTSTGDCYMAATGLDYDGSLGLDTEIYGPDETVFVERAAGDDVVTITRATPLEWSTSIACASPTPCLQTANACQDFIGICSMSTGSPTCSYSEIPPAAPCSQGSGVCDAGEPPMCVQCTTEQCSDGYFCNGLETCEFGQCRNNTVETPCDFCHEGFDVCTNSISDPSSVPSNQALPFDYTVQEGSATGPIEGMSGYGGTSIDADPDSVVDFHFRVGRDYINGLGTTLRSYAGAGHKWEWLNPTTPGDSAEITWYSGSPGTSSYSSSTAESLVFGSATYTWDDSQAVGDAASAFITWDPYDLVNGPPSPEGTVTLRWTLDSSGGSVDYMGISFLKCGNGNVDISFGGAEEDCDPLLDPSCSSDTYCGV